MPRPQRFLESSASPRTTDLARAFYSDSQLDERMTHVRQTIVQVRQRWDTDRRWLADQLLRWLETQVEAAASSGHQQHQQELEAESDDWLRVLSSWRLILAVDRNWADLQPADVEQDFSVLREYTDEKSYSLIFSRVLQALRSSDDSQVMLIVYLIELINIDLFNYSRLQQPCESRAYRGMSLSEADWTSYRSVLERPVASRYVAVPLALTSASKSPEVALQFMLREGEKHKLAAGCDSPCVPCLLVLHVIDVPESLMELYRKRFPQSVVSTICAVDITGVSKHPDEQEVLLRGAFYQILSVQGPEEFAVQNQQPVSETELQANAAVTANTLEMLIISANRDHLSNGRLGDQDAPARALFAAIVRVTRFGYCLEFCRGRGLRTDEVEYAAALREAEQELHRLL